MLTFTTVRLYLMIIPLGVTGLLQLYLTLVLVDIDVKDWGGPSGTTMITNLTWIAVSEETIRLHWAYTYY